MIKSIKKLIKELGSFLTVRDKFYMDDLCKLYEPIINYPMSADMAIEILEVVGLIKQYGVSNNEIIAVLQKGFLYQEDICYHSNTKVGWFGEITWTECLDCGCKFDYEYF